MNQLLPTRTCFDDAIEFLGHVAEHDPKWLNVPIFLVHAICVSSSGREYSHAWVEVSELVIFSGIFNDQKGYFSCSKDDYYREFRVKDVTHYTPREACEQNVKHVNYGPWEEKYSSLCGREKVDLGNTHIMDVHPIGFIPQKEVK